MSPSWDESGHSVNESVTKNRLAENWEIRGTFIEILGAQEVTPLVSPPKQHPFLSWRKHYSISGLTPLNHYEISLGGRGRWCAGVRDVRCPVVAGTQPRSKEQPHPKCP